MKFARAVFIGAGIWGIVVLMPLYFLFDAVGKWYPPQVTHPDFYYGFTAVALAWQIAFLVIGSDPGRFAPLMLPAICEKAFYVVTLVVLYARRRIELGQLATAAPDFAIACLFVAAAIRVQDAKEQRSGTGTRFVRTGTRTFNTN